MKEQGFWHENESYIDSVMNTVNMLADDTYIYILHLKQNRAWFSETARAYFGIRDTYASDHYEIMRMLVHPDDWWEYEEGIPERTQGINLDRELCVRMKDASGQYHMFSFHTDIVTDEKNAESYLLVLLHNENVLPKIDAMTDLYSQARFVEDLSAEIDNRKPFAVLMIKLERFTNLNIIYGNDFTNRILKETALQFIYMMNEDSAVYRLDGPKFGFILSGCGREKLLAFEQTLRNKLAKGIQVDNRQITLKICAGAIFIENEYDGKADSLSSKAAYALEHSEAEHQGKLIIFNDEVCISKNADLDLMRVIHQSVRDGCDGFYVEYQPIVASQTGSIAGAEALVRWRKEPYGTVPPGMFIEWMEKDPGMYELGNHVLQTALRETVELLTVLPEFVLNVNVSARQMEREEFRAEVLHLLEETKFPAGNLCLELTERCKDMPLETIKKEVEFFQGYGIRMAMDDYGTGSASSGIVLYAPMDEIKLDMSFIRGITEDAKKQAMVKSIVDFANASGMSTCLEGVEDEELQNYLRGYQATWFQGYYYSKPVEIERLKGLVESGCVV
ncbi:MAG: GGDEF domain-containing phosphodiesterase [Bacillus sp. (in: Bacteria)]|nr:GGDEF domain-containing phosphodiesterase [Bacillus sp. (in: firmicutes)]MCM1426070.1 GGDEF domain-containing phosphodiesterase [Eubacterium sp.]